MKTLLPFLALACLAVSPLSADPSLDAIQHQLNVEVSYTFTPIPATAGNGISVAVISGGVSHDIKNLLGDRLTAVSTRSGDDNPFQVTEGISSGLETELVSIVAALAPQSKIIAIKATDEDGSGTYGDIRDAITRAAALGAKIIVVPLSSSSSDPGVTAAITAATQAGAIVVASAGDESAQQPGFPASLDGVLAIGATDGNGAIAHYSNTGGKIIFAPGTDILCQGTGSDSNTISGTSHSATVAGAIIAVVWSQYPTLTNTQILAAITGTLRTIHGADGSAPRLIDGQAALQAAAKISVPVTPPPAPAAPAVPAAPAAAATPTPIPATTPPANPNAPSGNWTGYWVTPDGLYFLTQIHFQVAPDGSLTGNIHWTFVKSPDVGDNPKLGLTAIEYVKGTYDPVTRILAFAGDHTDDPNNLIDVDKYKLLLADNNQVIAGSTLNHGDWKGLLFLTASPP